MTDLPHNSTNLTTTPQARKLWVRACMMLVLCLSFQLAAWVLLLIALVQLGATAVTDTPLSRLTTLGRSLGRYLTQIAAFACFQTEEAPFPFSDWPGDSD